MTDERKHVEAASVMAKFAGLCRDANDDADDAGDKVTADLFTGVARELDKLAWFVESHGVK